MDHEEAVLIRKAQRGDYQAFESLVRKYDSKVLSIALDMVGNVEDAKDIYQEVFIRVFCSLPQFRFQCEFFTWLYRITVNYTINFRKKKNFRSSFYTASPMPEDSEMVIIDMDATNAPQQNVEKKDFLHHINHALELLSPKQRSVFVLRHFHDHKLVEISEIMQCNLGTVKNSLFRAHQKVRRYLQDLELT